MVIPILGVTSREDPFDIARRVKEIDPDLYLAWNPRVNRFEVHDAKAPGGTMVMRVQEPDGRFRVPDGRVLETLRANRRERFPEVLREIEAIERARDRAWEAKTEDVAYGVADELRFYGKVVAPGFSEAEDDAGQGNVA